MIKRPFTNTGSCLNHHNYTWLLFDADGTLFDYDQTERKALIDTFGHFHQEIPPNLIPTYRSINGKMFQALEAGQTTLGQLKIERFRELLAHYNSSTSPESFSLRYLNNLVRFNQLIPGTEEVIKRLSETFKMMIITNGIASVQKPRFAQSPIASYFSDLVISDEVNCAKPFKEIFDICFDRMGQPTKDQVLIIGDSLSSDIQGGITYGIDTCWYNPNMQPRTSPTPTYTIQTLSELIDLLRLD